MANKLIKPIKSALGKVYGFKNVSVKNGSGTAWGWVEINVTLNNPHTITHNQIEKDWFGNIVCKNCRDFEKDIHKEIYEIASKALSNENMSFYTYTNDMGYDNEEVLIDVEFLK